MKDIKIFNKVSVQFYFKALQPGQSDYTTLIFVKQDRILELDFTKSVEKCVETIYIFQMPLNRQPEFFQMNDEQKLMIISSAEDGVYIDMLKRQEIDLDDKFNIGCIKEIIHDQEDGFFYVLANKYDEKLGFFLIRMNDSDTNDFKFLTKYKNKLDIGDATVSVLRDREKGYKELVISYKTIYINTYNVHVMDITQEGQPTLYKHESFQLWESESKGLLLQNRGDFLKLSKAGAEIIALGSEQKRMIVDDLGNDRILHSLESVNYLKIDPDNFITFECADENKIISVYQEYSKYLYDDSQK